MTYFDVPFPPKQLSPNSRLHWAKKFRVAANYRAACFAYCKVAKAKVLEEGPVEVGLWFHPPDNRKRDLDNLLASFKAGLDGISLALGADDSRFRLTIQKVNTIPPDGKISVSITQGTPSHD